MTRSGRVSLLGTILALAVAMLAGAASAKDEPTFGPAVDAFCTAENRDPATPYADGKSSFPTSECQLCHMPLTFDKVNVTEGFNQWKLATKPENLRPDGTPDFSWFCPPSTDLNHAPVLNPIGDWTLDEGELLAFLVTASDPDGDALTFNGVNVPTGAVLADRGNGTAHFSWTPTYAQAGDFDVTFSVADDGVPMQGDSEQIRITVMDVNRPPTLDPIGDQLGSEGELLAFSLTASDPDGDKLSFAGIGLPTGATLLDHGDGTADFSWTPPLGQFGNFNVTFSVTDDGVPMQGDSEQIRITVGNVNRPPTLDPIGNRTLIEGEMLVISLTASDPDGDALSISASELPAGATFLDHGNGTAEFGWTPDSSQIGDHTVTFIVTDDGVPAESDTETILITVSSVGAGSMHNDATLDAGVDFLQLDLGPTPSDDETIYMTGGAAAADYDGDGWVDLYVTRLDAPDLLFHNRGDGTFEDVTAAAGLDLDLPSNGAAWGDVDNDNDPDLYVTTLGPVASRFYLFINDGNGGFTEEAVERGAAFDGPGAHYGQSVTFGDYDGDGWLDLHTTEWRPADLAPAAESNARLLHNRGISAPGYFEDVTASAGVALETPEGVLAFSSRFTDLDGDGWSDLLVVGDGGTSHLFWNRGDGTFEDGTASAGVGTDENGTGSAVGDFDGDGLLDWFVTGIYHPENPCADSAVGCAFGVSGNRLYLNTGARGFVDATDSAGVRDGYWGTAAALYDLDNDGDLDLAMTNGAEVPFLTPPADAPYARFVADPLRVWRNEGEGVTIEISDALGMTDLGAGRGLLTFDYDRDGDLDLFVVNNAGAPVLYRNGLDSTNAWLRVRTQGTDSNASGIGAVVRVWTTPTSAPQIREIEAGSHYLGQSECTAHFGLGEGSDPVHRVEVHWPATGRQTVFANVSRNTEILAVEPAEPVSGGGSPDASSATDPAPDPGGVPYCGLLGVEPLVVLAMVRRRIRRRAAQAAREPASIARS